MQAAQAAKRHGHWTSSIWEHPEDLGRTYRGQPASIWQLPEVRRAFQELRYITVAGHPCQIAGVDMAKPTRLLTDIKAMADFGYLGWPVFYMLDM